MIFLLPFDFTKYLIAYFAKYLTANFKHYFIFVNYLSLDLIFALIDFKYLI